MGKFLFGLVLALELILLSGAQAAELKGVFRISSSAGQGNGVLISYHGKLGLVTNFHVVENAAEVSVASNGFLNKATAATEIIRYPNCDLAVVILPPSAFLNPRIAEEVAVKNLRVCKHCPVPSSDIVGSTRLLSQSMLGDSADLKIWSSENGTEQALLANRIDAALELTSEHAIKPYAQVWKVSAGAGRGKSGGGLFKGDDFIGLVTQVSLTMSLETFAIKTSDLALKLMYAPDETTDDFVVKEFYAKGGNTGNGGRGPILNNDSQWSLYESPLGVSKGQKQVVESPFADPGTRFLQSAERVAAFRDLQNRARLNFNGVKMWEKTKNGLVNNANHTVNNSRLYLDLYARPPWTGLPVVLAQSIGSENVRYLVAGENLAIEWLPSTKEVHLTYFDPTYFKRASANPGLLQTSLPQAVSAPLRLISQEKNIVINQYFAAADGSARAILIFDNEDYSKPKALIVETEHHVFEFKSCFDVYCQ